MDFLLVLTLFLASYHLIVQIEESDLTIRRRLTAGINLKSQTFNDGVKS